MIRQLFIKKELKDIGIIRQREVVKILKSIYQEKGFKVWAYEQKHSGIIDRIKKRPKGDVVWHTTQGITIINRIENKPLDIVVYKNGQLWSVWEITNYSQDSYFQIPKFRTYIDNLTKYSRPCYRFLVVSFPNNFRRLFPEKDKEYNIKWAEKELAKNEIFLIYWELQHKVPELKAWID